MKSYLLAPLGVVLLLGLAGCAASRDAAWPPPSPLGSHLPFYQPPPASEQESLPTLPQAPQKLSLQEALARALLYNPDLQVFGWEIRAREAQTLQAGLWTNPEIEVELEAFGGTEELSGTAAAELGLSLRQQLPLGGDVRARRRVAARKRDLAGWDYEAARLDVFTTTAKTFAAVLAAQERLQLADSLLALSQQFARTVADRASAGKVSALEASRADIVRANAEIARTHAARSLTTTRTRLASLWGNPDSDFEQVIGNFDDIRAVPVLQVVTEHVSQNPNVARFAAEMALRQADLRLAKAERIPNPTVTAGPSYFNELDETAFRAGIAIPLPLFDRNQGSIQEARYRIRQVEARARATQMEVQRQLAAAYETLASAYTAATTLRDEILPTATETLAATEEGYREGKFDLLTVLDAQRTLFEATNQYIDDALTYHQSRADVERLIGTPLSDLED